MWGESGSVSYFSFLTSRLGLDKTHNPEFTACEFYSTYTNLKQLMDITHQLITFIASHILPEDGNDINGLFSNTIPTVDFIPALNDSLGFELPNLASDSARLKVLAIFEGKSIPLPLNPTLPRLLDKLSSLYLEPHCQNFTFIVNHPECLSPLSKTFIHPTAANNQPVGARAELFVQGRELVNCYEEENSPFEQRRKFQMQHIYAAEGREDGHSDETLPIDDDYIRALEWGLPPTGGWGCGVDRLVMFFGGVDKIGDVLSFGNLRAVTRGHRRLESEMKYT